MTTIPNSLHNQAADDAAGRLYDGSLVHDYIRNSVNKPVLNEDTRFYSVLIKVTSWRLKRVLTPERKI